MSRKHETGKIMPYQALANAVIEQAARDYRLALRRGDESQIKDIEKFFKSDWFMALSELDGEALMVAIRRETERKMKRRRFSVR